MGLLKAVELEAGVVANESLDDLSSEEVAVVGTVVAEEEFCLGTLLKDYQHAAVDHHVDQSGECLSPEWYGRSGCSWERRRRDRPEPALC